MAHKIGLRVAIIWRGTVLQERMFSADKGEHVVFSGDVEKKHVMIIPDFKSDVQALIPDGDGYNVFFPEHATGSMTRAGKEETLAELKKEAKQQGSVETVEGTKKLFMVQVKEGDWGLITINEVTIYFQLRNAALAAPITAFDLPFKAPLAASIVISGILHATFLMIMMLHPEADPLVQEMKALDRFASFMVQDVNEPVDEPELPPDVPIEQQTSSKKAGGEEGKFGDKDSEFEDSKLVKNDGEMVDKIDVKKIGINRALSGHILSGSGALKNVFGGGANLDATINVAMAGDGSNGTLQIGRGAGGTGFRGNGSGGGGEGIGRIGGVGQVDTGGGNGRAGAKIGHRKTVKAKPKMATGTPNLGDFCDKNNIRRVVGAKNNAIRYCFEHELQSNPSLAGKIIASWQIGLDGSVMNASIASSTLNNKNVESCVTRIIKMMRFQKPDGGICVIKYPFVFTGLE